MGERIQELPEGISKLSAWPYEVMPGSAIQRRRQTGWVMAISIEPELGGLVTFYPAGTGRQVLHIDNGTWNGKKITTKPFYRINEKEQAEKFVITFCSRGHSTSPGLLPHQDGEFWAFNWSSLTQATVGIASQVADHFFNDRRDEAWAVGRAFGDQIRAAENAHWKSKGK